MAGSSSPPSDPLFNSDPPYSALTPASSLRLPAARLVSFLSAGSGRIPANVNGPSGSPSGNPSGRIPANVNGPSGSPSGSPATNSECKMVAVRGLEVASFTVNGEELICLPQVFELFLKQLVGGLHTVYTKLKRLRITPVVCSVEQVRVLRSVGAIQPGVNRCKLISRADFRQLYTDCTTSSSRPGRPPKRALGVASMTDSSRLLPHGLLNPALLSQTGLTAAAMTEAVKLQKMRMMIGLHGNNDHQRQHNSTESESEELNSNTDALSP
ncbi:dachshund homolog 1-like [Polymixia lowei]